MNLIQWSSVCGEFCSDCLSNALVSCQVVEKVSVIVMDANDERPQFQNMPSILDVPEVRNLVSENPYLIILYLII